MGNGFGLKLKKIYRDTYDFLTEKWVVTHEEHQASRLQRFAHFWLLVFKSFARNKGPLRATALAYTTLLGLVPLLAVGFGVASSFLKEKGASSTRDLIQQFVDATVPQLQLLATDTNKVTAPTTPENSLALPKSTPRDEVVDRINGFIQNAQSKTLGVSGMIGFVLVAILLLATIEDTFNDIWGVTRGRSWFRRFVQYWTTISLGPLVLALIVVLVSNTVFQSGRKTLETLPLVGGMILPFVLVSAAFALFYKLMPNTQVHWRAATIAGVVGGTLWLLLNIFSTFQLSRVVSMSRIYGTLALVPIFLLGLYFSWLILLFGAQVAYALQNRKVYLQERKAESVNQRGREYVALRVMTYLAQRFAHGAKPATILELATLLGVPSRLIGRVLQPLIQAGLVLEVSGGSEGAYAPARPLEGITGHDILYALRVVGGQELATRDEPTRVHVCAEFDRINDAERQAASAVTLKDLVQRIPYIEAHHDHDKVEELWKHETISS
jgi:membrane protein